MKLVIKFGVSDPKTFEQQSTDNDSSHALGTLLQLLDTDITFWYWEQKAKTKKQTKKNKNTKTPSRHIQDILFSY